MPCPGLLFCRNNAECNNPITPHPDNHNNGRKATYSSSLPTEPHGTWSGRLLQSACGELFLPLSLFLSLSYPPSSHPSLHRALEGSLTLAQKAASTSPGRIPGLRPRHVVLAVRSVFFFTRQRGVRPWWSGKGGEGVRGSREEKEKNSYCRQKAQRSSATRVAVAPLLHTPCCACRRLLRRRRRCCGRRRCM